VHLRRGATRDRSLWGDWHDDTIKSAISTKRKHYQPYEHNSRLCFLPLVVSKYNNVCDDFLRLLWLLAEAQFDAAIAHGIVDNDVDIATQIKVVAARLRSRIACASAVGVAKRLASYAPHDFQQSIVRAPLDFDNDAPLFPF